MSKVEGSMAIDKNGAVFYPLEGETDEDYDNRVARWKAGEKVEGQDRLCTGNEPHVIVVKYVAAKKRDE